MESIGKRCKRLRVLMGLSQADMAKRMSVRRETIGTWERGKNIPQNICKSKLEGILNNFETLIGESDKL